MITSYVNDAHLLLRIAKGDEKAFQELFDTYKDKLYTYAFRLTESKEFSEDAVHDTFLKIWLNRDSLSEIKNINAYLFRIAHNHIYNGFRRKAKETLILAELEKKLYVDFNNADNRLVLNEVRAFIDNAINKLTPQQKQVFKMSREEGLKLEEIAEKLNISLFTVKKHLTNALNYLRKEVAGTYQLYAIALFVMHKLHQ